MTAPLPRVLLVERYGFLGGNATAGAETSEV